MAAVSAMPGSVPIVRWRRGHPREPAGRVDGAHRLGADILPAHPGRILHRDHHIGDVTVDDVVVIEDDRADRLPGGQLLDGVAIRLVGGEQRQLGQRRPEQGVGTSARPSSSRTAAASANSPRRRRTPRAPPARRRRPARTTSTTATRRSRAGFHRRAHRGRRRVLVDQRCDGLAQHLTLFERGHANASSTRRRWVVGSPQAECSACTRSSHSDRSCSEVNPMAPCVCSDERPPAARHPTPPPWRR